MDEMKIYPLVDFSDEPMYGNNIEKLQLLQTLERNQREILLFVFEFVNWKIDALCAVYKRVATRDKMNQYNSLMSGVYGSEGVGYYLQKISDFDPMAFSNNMKPLYSSKEGILFLDEEKLEAFSLEDFFTEIKREKYLAEQEELQERYTIRTGETHEGAPDFVLDAANANTIINNEGNGIIWPQEWREDHEPMQFFNEQLGELYVPPVDPPGYPYMARTLQEPPREEAIYQEAGQRLDEPQIIVNQDRVYINGTARNDQIVMRNNAITNNTTDDHTGTSLNFDTWNNIMAPIIGFDAGNMGGDFTWPIAGT